MCKYIHITCSCLVWKYRGNFVFVPRFSWFWVRAPVVFKVTTTKLLVFWWRPLRSLATFVNNFSFAGIGPPLKKFWALGKSEKCTSCPIGTVLVANVCNTKDVFAHFQWRFTPDLVWPQHYRNVQVENNTYLRCVQCFLIVCHCLVSLGLT